jgi:hypothetical protein
MPRKYNNIFVNQLIKEFSLGLQYPVAKTEKLAEHSNIVAIKDIKIPKFPPGYKKVLLKISEKTNELIEKRKNDYSLIHTKLTKIFGSFNFSIILDIFKYILLKSILFSLEVNI